MKRKILAIGKRSAWYSDRKKLIGKMFRVDRISSHREGGFVGVRGKIINCDLNVTDIYCVKLAKEKKEKK